ncbi:MAG: hypothetical protein DWQ20_00740 [Actinobacteria bacterium]|nr:MAG: hypothetical protein DWQ20_00740 [Actinomycetota bacterium]
MAIYEIGTASNATSGNTAGDTLVHSLGEVTMTVADFSAREEYVDFIVKPEASPIYGSSVPLIISMTGTLWHRGGGRMYIDADNSGAGSATNLIAGIQNLGTCDMYLTGSGTYTSVHNNSRMDILAQANLTNLYTGGGLTKVRYNSSDNTIGGRLLATGGTLLCERGFDGSTTHVISSGAEVRFWREDPTGDYSSLTVPAITNGTLVVAGNNGNRPTRLDWRGGNIATLIATGNSVIDFRRTPKDATVSTIIWSAQAKAQSYIDPEQVDVDITLSSDTEVLGVAATDFAVNAGSGGNA